MSNISVVYSMTRLGKEPFKQTGKGFINESGVLLLKVKKADGTYKWKGIDDYQNYLFPIFNKPNEYQGYYVEYHENTLVPRPDGSWDTLDLTETQYHIWIKKIR